jgi:hypothetical protein
VTLDRSGCADYRDLGGTATMDDRPLHTGALLRSGDLYRLAAATVRATRAGAISRIVDFGWAAELVIKPFVACCGWLSRSGVGSCRPVGVV